MRHHACKGHHLRHVLRSWRNWERTAQQKGWKSCRPALTSSTKRLQDGCGNDGQKKCCSLCRPSTVSRVREAAGAFKKRTSCADDHLLREVDEDIWETLANCFQFRLLNHRTEDHNMLWARQLVTMVQKKERQTHNERIPPNCHAPNDVLVVLIKCCNSWQARQSTPGPWPSSPLGGLHPAPHGGASKLVADTNIRDGL